MATMNPVATGGPVGGGMMMMMANGSPANNTAVGSSTEATKRHLNTYIYEYLAKMGHHDLARALVKDSQFEINILTKQSPNRRKDGDMNGDAGENMDTDDSDNVPDDLPRTISWNQATGSGFLFEWFSTFFDLFNAHQGRGKSMNTAVGTYLNHHQQIQRLRENQQNQNIRPTGVMNPMMMRNMQQNGMVNGDQRKMPAMTPQMQQQMRAQKMAHMHAMPRGEQPETDMSDRPGTPADADNTGSPSKRPRLEGQQFNPAMMPNGRPGAQGAAGQGMLMQTGFNPNMNAAQFRPNGAMPPQAMKGNMANGMMTMGTAGSPMMPMSNQFADGIPMDVYNQQRGMPGAPGQGMQGGPGGQTGNHALQDYQMQLMLLEQQNKKRLMMARQEQHENNPGSGNPMAVGMQPGMSPPGSRSGASPNPIDQMKRTPGLGGLPGSPSAADTMQGRSPASMSFMNGMQPDYNNSMFMEKNQPMMPGVAPNMRPPTADMNGMRPQNARMAGQFQGGQPMVQQMSQGQMGTPGQRGDMPPPQAPAATSAQRNQTGSPANANATPTPSQQNKSNPKGKKGKEEPNRKKPTKKNSTANAPTSDDNPPVTPQPSTPITPNNANIANNNVKGQANMPNAQPAQGNGMQMAQPQMPSDLNQYGMNETFSMSNVNLDFSTLDNADVLENFDFDTFLNTSNGDELTFDANFNVEGFAMDQADQ